MLRHFIFSSLDLYISIKQNNFQAEPATCHLNFFFWSLICTINDIHYNLQPIDITQPNLPTNRIHFCLLIPLSLSLLRPFFFFLLWQPIFFFGQYISQLMLSTNFPLKVQPIDIFQPNLPTNRKHFCLCIPYSLSLCSPFFFCFAR